MTITILCVVICFAKLNWDTVWLITTVCLEFIKNGDNLSWTLFLHNSNSFWSSHSHFYSSLVSSFIEINWDARMKRQAEFKNLPFMTYAWSKMKLFLILFQINQESETLLVLCKSLKVCWNGQTPHVFHHNLLSMNITLSLIEVKTPHVFNSCVLSFYKEPVARLLVPFSSLNFKWADEIVEWMHSSWVICVDHYPYLATLVNWENVKFSFVNVN